MLPYPRVNRFRAISSTFARKISINSAPEAFFAFRQWLRATKNPSSGRKFSQTSGIFWTRRANTGAKTAMKCGNDSTDSVVEKAGSRTKIITVTANWCKATPKINTGFYYVALKCLFPIYWANENQEAMKKQNDFLVTVSMALFGGFVMTALAAVALWAFFCSFDTLNLLPADDPNDAFSGYAFLAIFILIYYFPSVFLAGTAGFAFSMWQALKRFDASKALKLVSSKNILYASTGNISVLILGLIYTYVALYHLDKTSSTFSEALFLDSACGFFLRLSMFVFLASILTANIKLFLSFRQIPPKNEN